MNSNQGVIHTKSIRGKRESQLTLKGPWDILPQIRSVEAAAMHLSSRDKNLPLQRSSDKDKPYD
jgi:hypothetical protein